MRIAIFLLTCVSAFGQFASQSMRWSEDGDTMALTLGGVVNRFPLVTNAPYYGEHVSEDVRTLADGTRISLSAQDNQNIWRDSEGRMRSERSLCGNNLQTVQGGKFVLAEIHDPLAGYAYVIDDNNKLVHRFTLLPLPVWNALASRDPAKRPPPPVVEQLGQKNMKGVVVVGTRMTNTIAVGAVGNDKPLVSTSESWYSQELQITVLAQVSDPRFGDNTVRMKNISRAEPNASLFVPPAGYALVDETGEFTMTLTKISVAR